MWPGLQSAASRHALCRCHPAGDAMGGGAHRAPGVTVPVHGAHPDAEPFGVWWASCVGWGHKSRATVVVAQAPNPLPPQAWRPRTAWPAQRHLCLETPTIRRTVTQKSPAQGRDFSRSPHAERFAGCRFGLVNMAPAGGRMPPSGTRRCKRHPKRASHHKGNPRLSPAWDWLLALAVAMALNGAHLPAETPKFRLRRTLLSRDGDETQEIPGFQNRGRSPK